ncbi:MAG: hypothetical protein Q4C82_08645 [Eubacteriales bacterium]|nr:hypothetical protein [Eubacteriales bacterium]
MSEYIIEEDRLKLLLYTLGNLALTLLLMLVCIYFANTRFYLGVFLGVTGIWYSVKYMFRYGKKLVRHTPVCEFHKHELVIHSLPRGSVTMQYRKIKEVRLLRDWKSVKLFFSSDEVTHPSGWNYVGVIWPFRRSGLDALEADVSRVLAGHRLTVQKTEKGKR